MLLLVDVDNTEMGSRDQDALMALFHATDGIQWRNHEGWGTGGTTRLSEWYGIEVDSQGQVVKVSLYANNLQGIPYAPGPYVCCFILEYRIYIEICIELHVPSGN